MKIHVYSPAGRWIAGGEVDPGLDRAEALRRIRRAVGPVEAEVGIDGRPPRPLPADDGRDLPDLAVFVTDARDAHLMGARPWPPPAALGPKGPATSGRPNNSPPTTNCAAGPGENKSPRTA